MTFPISQYLSEFPKMLSIRYGTNEQRSDEPSFNWNFNLYEEIKFDYSGLHSKSIGGNIYGAHFLDPNTFK